MSDQSLPTPLFLSTWSVRYSAGGWIRTLTTNAQVASITWPVANTAFYFPVYLPFPYPVKRVWWINGSSVTSVNVDLGIFTADGGVKVYSTGSTARAGTSAPQFVTADFLLPAGPYYFGMSCDSTTTNRGGAGSVSGSVTANALAGLLQEASALALPAVMTPVTVANVCVPLFGVTRTASGF